MLKSEGALRMSWVPSHLAMHHNQPAALQNPKCEHSIPKHLIFSRKPSLARLEKGRGFAQSHPEEILGLLFARYRPASHASILLGKYSDLQMARTQNLNAKQLHVVIRTSNSDRK